MSDIDKTIFAPKWAEVFELNEIYGNLHVYTPLKGHPLENHFQLVLVPFASEHQRVIVSRTVCAGSRHEIPGQTGVAHFLEHVAFKGTKKFHGNTGVWQLIGRKGGIVNAMTFADGTMFYFDTYVEQLFDVLKFEFDRSDPSHLSVLSDEDVKNEIKVVRNEKEIGLNKPATRCMEAIFSMMFHEHPYGHSTIGNKGDLEAVNKQTLLSFMDRNYFHRMQLVVAGNFGVKMDDVLDQVAATFGTLTVPPRTVEHPVINTNEPAQRGKRIQHIYMTTESTYIVFGHRVDKSVAEDNAVLPFICDLISNHQNSRISAQLVQKGICRDVETFSELRRNAGALLTFVLISRVTPEEYEKRRASYTAPGDIFPKSLEEFENEQVNAVIAVIEEVFNAWSNKAIDFETFRRQGFDSGILFTANVDNYIAGKKKSEFEALRKVCQDHSAISELLGMAFVHGDVAEPFVNIDRVQNVTLEDIHAFAQRYLSETSRSIVVVMNKDVEKDIPRNLDTQDKKTPPTFGMNDRQLAKAKARELFSAPAGETQKQNYRTTSVFNSFSVDLRTLPLSFRTDFVAMTGRGPLVQVKSFSKGVTLIACVKLGGINPSILRQYNIESRFKLSLVRRAIMDILMFMPSNTYTQDYMLNERAVHQTVFKTQFNDTHMYLSVTSNNVDNFGEVARVFSEIENSTFMIQSNTLSVVIAGYIGELKDELEKVETTAKDAAVSMVLFGGDADALLSLPTAEKIRLASELVSNEHLGGAADIVKDVLLHKNNYTTYFFSSSSEKCTAEQVVKVLAERTNEAGDTRHAAHRVESASSVPATGTSVRYPDRSAFNSLHVNYVDYRLSCACVFFLGRTGYTYNPSEKETHAVYLISDMLNMFSGRLMQCVRDLYGCTYHTSASVLRKNNSVNSELILCAISMCNTANAPETLYRMRLAYKWMEIYGDEYYGEKIKLDKDDFKEQIRNALDANERARLVFSLQYPASNPIVNLLYLPKHVYVQFASDRLNNFDEVLDNYDSGLSSLEAMVNELISARSELGLAKIEYVARLFGSDDTLQAGALILQTIGNREVDEKTNIADIVNRQQAAWIEKIHEVDHETIIKVGEIVGDSSFTAASIVTTVPNMHLDDRDRDNLKYKTSITEYAAKPIGKKEVDEMLEKYNEIRKYDFKIHPENSES